LAFCFSTLSFEGCKSNFGFIHPKSKEGGKMLEVKCPQCKTVSHNGPTVIMVIPGIYKFKCGYCGSVLIIRAEQKAFEEKNYANC
jgi:phage FluMu protein Com